MEQALHAERVAEWKRQAGRWLDDQPQGRLFTADTLVDAVGKPDTGQGRNNAIGAWIGAQSKGKRIEFTGRLSKSDRVEGHGNLQKLWRVKDQREERAGGDVDDLGPQAVGGVSSSTFGLEEASGAADTADGAATDVSSSPVLPPLTVSEEEEQWEALRDPGFLADDGGEQLGLLGQVSSPNGAYSEAA